MKINAPTEHDADCGLPNTICIKCYADSMSDEEWNNRIQELEKLDLLITRIMESDITEKQND